MRIDKWLWVARFFKTRSKAKEAVLGGKVHVNGERTKAARDVQIGDKLEISRGYDKEMVVIKALAERRGNGTAAQALYEETEESLNRRLEDAANRRMARAGLATPKLKPTKSARRALRELKQKPA
ncbi:MAG: S4 domain-containing protein [Gammaproteobacteria bacterium]|nr:S4 domain-containing protein [Gammaproteobacteria bacterium]